MKNIAIFLLVGLSLFSNGNCFLIYDHMLEAKCVDTACKEVSDMPKILIDFMCTFGKKETEGDEKKIGNIMKKVQDMMKGFGCAVKFCDMDLAELAGKELEELAKSFHDTCLETDVMKALSPVMEKICTIVDPLVQSQCLHKFLTGITGTVQQKTDKDNIDMEKIKSYWVELDCGMGDAMTGLSSLPEPANGICKCIMSDTVKNMMNDENVKKIGDLLLCVGKSVLGVVGKGVGIK
ncbi:uncharacterized protein ACNLHF_026915 isoform 2-T2 [Anomaloglossus baeobatrachus]|uniref:uncharacterized protein LOC142249403 isoform X2 n=1 Tax=Anomaloglossus baeobatrachus TaxID=238106 RepID=UPI003F500A32